METSPVGGSGLHLSQSDAEDWTKENKIMNIFQCVMNGVCG